MKKFSLLFIFLFLSISFSTFSFSGTAYVTSLGEVVAVWWTNPYTQLAENVYAGTFNGTLDGNPAKFYCIDINHLLQWSDPVTGPTYNEGSSTSPQITYILNNYYPFKSFGYPGSLSDVGREAASIQNAIWYFSDGLNVNTLDQSDILTRALEIIADANSNAGNLLTGASLVITSTGNTGEFYVTALDQNNNPLSGVTVNLTSLPGPLSSYSEITGVDGKTSVITAAVELDYTAIVNATASINIPQGTIYLLSTTPNANQKLVLATPNLLPRQVTLTFDGPLPVELSSFTSNTNGRNIQLNWETKTEKNSDKFVIERKASGTNWESIGSVKAAVLSNSPKNYSYTDTKLQSGKYQYRLKMVDNDGSFSYSSVEAAEVAIPKDFAVSQNYPNPFNPSTKIDYQVPVDAKVILEVYNIAGQKVIELVNQEQSAGYYTVDFGASKLSSGVYIYRLAASDKATGNNFSSIKKMMLLK
jgi:hypothetical protein